MDDLINHLVAYFEGKGYAQLSNNLGVYFFLASILLGTIIPVLVKLTKRLLRFIKQKRASRDLHPFYLPSEVKAATNFYIKTKCQNIPPADLEELRSNHAFAVQENLMPFFLKKAFPFKSKTENRFYFVLSDSGMGKTTFLINLFIRYSNKLKKAYKIRLLPLGSSKIDEELKNINSDERRKTILLLDAFDEDIRASVDYKFRLQEIVDLVWDYRIVIITSRTQFFDSDSNEPNNTGVFKFGGDKGHLSFQKIYISPFSDRDIKKYLRKKYLLFQISKRKKGFKIIKNCPNLMVRPMLLAYMDDLINFKNSIRNASQSYEALISKWIEREALRLEVEKRAGFKSELRKFSDEIALDIYKNRQRRGGLYITSQEIKDFAYRNRINLSTLEMKSRSLLNRHSSGYYKFSHRSILEYLLATKIFKDKGSVGSIDLKSFDQAYKFYLEILWDDTKTTKLKESIDLSHKLLYEIEPLPDLVRLKYIDLQNNYISKINSLSNCNSLIGLQLNNNKITDISPLKSLQNIQYLYLRGNSITDISMLQNLKSLKVLDLTSNPIDKDSLDQLKKSLKETEIVFRK